MKKSVFYLATALLAASTLFGSCADNSSEPSPGEEKEGTGTIAFTIDFAKSADSRSDIPPRSDDRTTGSSPTTAISDAIPLTSWDNIHSLQIFLYDQNNFIVFSRYISGDEIKQALETDPFNTGRITYTYANVPNGIYHLVAVANANSATEPVVTYLNGLAMRWNQDNVLKTYIHRARIEHKPYEFPRFYLDDLAATGVTRTSLPFHAPAEIFMGVGHQTDMQIVGEFPDMVQVIAEQEIHAEIKLERQVSMMRLRVNLGGENDNLNNADVNLRDGGKLNFSSHAMVMVVTLPSVMLPIHDDMIIDDVNYYKGVSPVMNQTDILVTEPINNEVTRHFYDENPTKGYVKKGYATDAGFPGDIVNIPADPYSATSWRDILVMPNHKAHMLTPENPVINENRYLLVISALGLPGHECKEGVLTEPHTVYWVGYINEPFEPGKIREVNVTFKDGGQMEVPTRPDNSGTLTIVVKEPQDWNPVHKVTNVEL